jgi:hypothetical protein
MLETMLARSELAAAGRALLIDVTRGARSQRNSSVRSSVTCPPSAGMDEWTLPVEPLGK